MLRGRRVVLGVSGGIAAYKAIEVCRRLVDAGAHVSPVLTPDSLHFVTAQTFSALASEPARTSLWDSPEPSPHTHLGQNDPDGRRATERDGGFFVAEGALVIRHLLASPYPVRAVLATAAAVLSRVLARRTGSVRPRP